MSTPQENLNLPAIPDAQEARELLPYQRQNVSSIEGRNNAMMREYASGRTLEQIARRYGLSQDSCMEFIHSAIDESLAVKDHSDFQSSSIKKLLMLDHEIAELDYVTPTHEYLSKQVIDSNNKKRVVREKVSNVLIKAKLKSERRHLTIATKTILAGDTGEGSTGHRDTDAREILQTLKDVTNEVVGEMVASLVGSAEEVGRLRERQESASTVNIGENHEPTD